MELFVLDWSVVSVRVKPTLGLRYVIAMLLFLLQCGAGKSSYQGITSKQSRFQTKGEETGTPKRGERQVVSKIRLYCDSSLRVQIIMTIVNIFRLLYNMNKHEVSHNFGKYGI